MENIDSECCFPNLPVRWAGNANWRDIYVGHGWMVYDGYGKVPWRKCQWCGAVGLYIVARTSNLTDKTYEDWACEEHAKGWLPKDRTVKEQTLEFPIKTLWGTIEPIDGTPCCQCHREAKYLFIEFGPGQDAYCSMHIDSFLPQTYTDGEQGEIGTITAYGDSYLTRVVLAEFDPNDFRWHVEHQYGITWESAGCGWARTREGALLRWIEREALKAKAVSLTAPDALALYEAETTYQAAKLRKEQEEQAQKQADAKAQRDAAAAFWVAAETRFTSFKGKRGKVQRTEYNTKKQQFERVAELASGTIYGPLAVVRGEKDWDYNRQYHVFHIPTGLTLSQPLPTQRDAKIFTMLLLESGIDWNAVARNVYPDGTGKLVNSLLGAVRERHCPPITTIEQAAS